MPVALEPLQIGALTVDWPVMLAPMAGYTDLPFRRLCKRYGAGMVYTEVATVEGIIRGTPRTMHYLETYPQERPIGVQVYGANPDSIAQAAQEIERMGVFDLLDINCGCPARKITRRGAGVALMRAPEAIRNIVQAVRAATSLPLTVKTRLGLAPHRFNIDQVAHAVEQGGADAVVIHARFASDKHSGPVHWEALKQIKQALNIPVIGNGGIRRPQDAAAMLEQTGVDGVMIGRGAFGNPWIFEQIKQFFANGTYISPSWPERRAVIAEHLELLYARAVDEGRWRKRRRVTAELVACRKFRSHLIHYLSGINGVSELRRKLDTLDSRAAIMAAVDDLLAQESGPPVR